MGVKYPQTFLKVATYLVNIAIPEILSGSTPVFKKFANKPDEFQREINEQLKTYAMGLFPFRTIRSNESVLTWWRGLGGKEGTDLIAVRTSSSLLLT